MNKKYKKNLLQSLFGVFIVIALASVLMFSGVFGASTGEEVLTDLTSIEGIGIRENYVFDFAFGSYGSGDGEFSAPQGLDLDSSGNIIVADTWNSRVQVFDNNGNFLFKFDRVGQLFLPYDVALDEFENIYVANRDGKIHKFDRNGNFLFEFEVGYLPEGVDLDEFGNIYVAESSSHVIREYDSNGNLIREIGDFPWEYRPGDCPGQFISPNDVAIDLSENIYVAELGQRIQKFDNTGEPLLWFGGNLPGWGVGRFNDPVGIDLDKSANIYVADKRNHRIQKFNNEGNFMLKIGSEGSGPGEFIGPTGVALDGARNIYVTDAGNHRIQKWRRVVNQDENQP